jgi:hypothetical protein
LTEAYAITIHKSQGISVTKIVLNLTGKAGFAPGLTYVAMSRVRSLKGLLIEEPFSLERLRFKATATIVMRNTDYERRKLQEIALPIQEEGEEEEFGSDISLPSMPPPSNQPSAGGQMTIPILHSEPGQDSTVPVPTSEQQINLPSEWGVQGGDGSGNVNDAKGDGSGNVDNAMEE